MPGGQMSDVGYDGAARTSAIAVLRKAALEFEGLGAARLAADCANAADDLRIATRGRFVLTAERDQPVWSVDVRHYDPKVARDSETPVSVTADQVPESAARMAFATLEMRAECGDPALPRPVRFRLWRGEELRMEVEWR